MRFARVVFGVTASLFLLNATIHFHLESKREINEPLVSKLQKSFYVDNLVYGSATEEEAYALNLGSKLLLHEGGFNLRKFITNNRILRDKIGRMESESLQYSGSRMENVLSHADSVLSEASQSLSIEPKKTTAFQDKALQDKALSVKTESQGDAEGYSSMSYGESMLGRTQIPLVGEKKILGVRWNVDGDQLVFDMQKPLITAIVESLKKRCIVTIHWEFFHRSS